MGQACDGCPSGRNGNGAAGGAAAERPPWCAAAAGHGVWPAWTVGTERSDAAEGQGVWPAKARASLG